MTQVVLFFYFEIFFERHKLRVKGFPQIKQADSRVASCLAGVPTPDHCCMGGRGSAQFAGWGGVRLGDCALSRLLCRTISVG